MRSRCGQFPVFFFQYAILKFIGVLNLTQGESVMGERIRPHRTSTVVFQHRGLLDGRCAVAGSCFVRCFGEGLQSLGLSK